MEEENVPECFAFLRRRRPAPAVQAPQTASAVPAQHSHGPPHDDHLASFGCCDFSLPSSSEKLWKLHDDDEALPEYEPAWGGYAFDEAATKTVEETIDSIGGELRELSLKIHGAPVK